MTDFEYTVADHIATLRLNRTEKKNAFTPEMLKSCRESLLQAQADDAVRVVVLTGSGDAFSSGGDMSHRAAETRETEPGPLARKQSVSAGPQSITLTLRGIDKPVIAAINGVAVGAGMDLALACDIRTAARAARFSEGYIRMGLVPGNGGCYFLPRLAGVSKALELLWTARFIDSEEALGMGIVDHVFDDETFDQQTHELAARIAAAPPIVVQAIKRTVYQSLNIDLATSLELISSHMAIVNSTEDYREAMAAYREKRPAKYMGK